MNNKPWAYVSSAWSSNKMQAKKVAKRYCRQLYNAGYTPICSLLTLQETLDLTVADERKDFLDMSEDLLRRSRILVLCGTGVDETVLNDIASERTSNEIWKGFILATLLLLLTELLIQKFIK